MIGDSDIGDSETDCVAAADHWANNASMQLEQLKDVTQAIEFQQNYTFDDALEI